MAQLVFIEGDTQPRPLGQLDPELVIAQRLGDYVVLEQQRAEHLGAPGQGVEGRPGMQRGGGAERAFEHGRNHEGVRAAQLMALPFMSPQMMNPRRSQMWIGWNI